jgi:hypothetical protein
MNVVVTFTDRRTSLNGSVRSGEGRADGDAAVLVFPVDSRLWTDVGMNPRRLRSVRPGVGGDFVFSDLPPGEYFIAAIPDEEADEWRHPSRLELISRRAARVTLVQGDAKVVQLTTVRRQ